MRTAVSLFAGIGGFDLALERSGVRVVASVEWDQHAQKILQKHFPNSTIYGDIQGVTGEQLRAAGFDPDEGIITGGFPCQDLSVAGKRAGLAGSRSGLFWEICRLLDETRTKTFILENVPGLLSSNDGKDMAVVVEALVERGYRIAWRVLDAQHFGVPQRRRRVFIVGCLGDSGRPPEEILALTESRAGYLATSNKKRKDTAKQTSDGARTGGIIGSDIVGPLQASDYKFPQQQQVMENKIVVELANDSSVARMRGFGDYTLDNTASSLKARDFKDATDLIFEQPTVFYGNRVADIRIQDDKINTLQARMGTGVNNMPMVAYPIDDAREIEKHQNGTGIGNEGDPAYTLDTRQAPAVDFAIQGTVIGRADTSGPQGKGFRNDGDPMFTLDRVSGHGVATQSTVRRLTPTECERLQGFPDGWTDGQADSHRYKQLGNAVAVPVVQWLIQQVIS